MQLSCRCPQGFCDPDLGLWFVLSCHCYAGGKPSIGHLALPLCIGLMELARWLSREGHSLTFLPAFSEDWSLAPCLC